MVNLKMLDVLPKLRFALSEKNFNMCFELLSEFSPPKIHDDEITYEERISDLMMFDYVKYFSWSIFDLDTISRIAAFIGDKKCLEVGAGNGLFAALLRAVSPSLDIVATDNFSSHGSDPAKCFTRVEHFDAVDAVRHFKDVDLVILIWPSSGSPMARNVLTEFEGKNIIYIGEGMSGCTADDDFHNLLDEKWKNLEIETPEFKNWNCIHDCIYFYERI